MTERETQTTRGPEPAFRLFQARAALLWERLWPAMWAPVALVGAFLVLALFNLLPMLPGWLHALVLVLLAAAFAFSLWRGFRGFALPDTAAARRRLERDTGLAHRPLHVLRDRPAGGDATALALWELHQQRMRDSVRRLRVSFPTPDVISRDPHALRVAVALLLIVAGIGAWGDWRPRLAAAVSPQFAPGPATAAATLDLWINPPEYTGLAPIFLKTAAPKTPTDKAPADKAAAPAAVAVPKGSVALARVSGGGGAPKLEVGGGAVPFDAVDASTFQIQRPVESGTRIAVTQGGGTLGSWPIQVIPDNPPAIDYASPPAKSERGALRIEYQARDDYGVTAANATVRLATPEGTAPALDRTPVELPLALPGVRPKEARNAGFHDLTAHPWAGLPVTVQLAATDGAGQTGKSEEFAMVLPERPFNHPVARAIIEERKKLTLNPEARPDAARALAEISARPGAYSHDIVVFMALRTALARLMLDQSKESIPEVQGLLWETALRIEDGGLSLAERDLREAERKLAEALDRNASDEELKRLMDELQQAMDKFMEAMEEQLRQALERGEQIPEIPPELANRMMDRNDLQQMLDQMRQMAETGARDAARQMLSQLQQMLENMRAGTMAQQGQQGQNQAWEMMRQLQELSQQQQQLMDQTFQQSQQGQQGQQGMQQPGGQQSPRGRGQQQQRGQGQQGQGSPTMQRQSEQQEALRRQLGEIMRRMGEMGGEIPRPFGRAERAMRDAGQALQQGQPDAALPSQGQAMDELQQGLQSYAEQMMQQMMGMQPGMQPGQQQQQRAGRNRDPLNRGREGGYSMGQDGTKIPDKADIQRSREILDELRRRSQQYTRPQFEREYIDRLLRQF
ncbi:MAG TPA: TIGR02302 family protein [Azospirillum sp.]|nr:TIGR02302 family protein [Azospirillum sp.]